MRRLLSVVIALAVLGGGGYGYYHFKSAGVKKITVNSPAVNTSDSNGPADINGFGKKMRKHKSHAFDMNMAGGDVNIVKAMMSKHEPNGPGFKIQGGPNDVNAMAKAKDVNDVNKPADPNEQMVAVNLNNVDLNNIITMLTEWTGKAIIPSDQATGLRLTVYSPKKVTRRQAMNLIFAAMRMKGFVLEQADNILYIKPIREAKLGSVMTLGSDQDVSKLADSGQMIEKVFKLQNSSASRMQEMVAPLMADYGQVTCDESTNSIIVIGTIDNLKRVDKLIKELDTPEADQTVTQVFEIKHGDPAEIAQLVRTLVGEGKSKSGAMAKPGVGQGQPQQGMPQQPQGMPGQQGGMQGNRGQAGGQGQPINGPARTVTVGQGPTPIVLIPEIRRKWIIARASADDMRQIASWIERLDKENPYTSTYDIVQVGYSDVMELSQRLASTIQRIPGGSDRTSLFIEPLTQSRQLIIFGSPDKRDIVKKLIQEIDVPSSSMFETQEFTLKYADPEQVQRNIDELYDLNKGMSSWNYRRRDYSSPEAVRVISYPTLKKVTVIASPQNMVKIRQQIASWDVPIDVNDVKPMIVELRNSDPVKMAELLSSLFSGEKSRGGGNDFFDYFFWPPRNNESRKSMVGPLYGQLSFEPVPETKKIMVISKTPQAYDVIKEIIAELDKHETAELPAVITLKYADAEDLAEQLNGVLNETGTTSMVKRSKRGLSEQKIDNDTGLKTSTAGRDDSDYSTNNMIVPWWDRARKDDKQMPISNVLGRIRFIPVHRSKSLLVVAPAEYMADIRSMIDELDRPGKQVMVKAIILEVNHDSLTALGAQLSSNPLAFGPVGENAASALSQLSYTDNRGNFAISTTSNISAIVDLLIRKANGKVLNQPTLWTKDNDEAEFFKGQSVAFIENAVTSTEGTSTRENFKYRPVGVTLRVRPNITPERAVDMTVNLIISQIQPQLVNGTIATSELNTTTHSIVSDGQTILIGGILFQQDSEIQRKIPLLGDIPLIGPIFRHYDIAKSNNELLTFITPYVVDENSLPETRKQIEGTNDRLKSLQYDLNKAVENAGND